MTKAAVTTKNPFIEKVLTCSLAVTMENGKIFYPMISPDEVEFFKAEKGNQAEGVFIARWVEFCTQTGRTNPFRGNGYVLLTHTGVLLLVPEWKSLENTLGRLTEGTLLMLTITDIATTTSGETYIRTSVMQSGKVEN